MDLNLLKIAGDVGTVAILLYVLLQLLAAYKSAFDRTASMLEKTIEDATDDDPKK
jgi:hypothetical protein